MTSLSKLTRALVAGAMFATVQAAIPVQGTGTQAFHYQPRAVDESTRLERLPATQRLQLSIGLPLRNQPELDALLAQLHNPVSPMFHKWITPQEFTERFGPTQADYDRVKSYMESQGLKVTSDFSNRLLICVDGSVKDVERVMHVQMSNYQHTLTGRIFHSSDVAPSLDLDVPISAINGLNNFVKPVPRLKKADAAQAMAAVSHAGGSGTGSTFIGKDFRNAYASGVASTTTGTGQGIALFEFSTYYAKDPTNYWNDAGLTAPALSNVSVAGGTTSNTGQDEVSLDIEVAGSLANGAHIYVYEGQDGTAIFNQIATDNTCKQVGVSWGWSTDSMTKQTDIDSAQDAVLQQMDAQGIAVFVAAGDSGTWTTSQWGQSTSSSSFNPINPADIPSVTCVGGSVVTTASAGGAWSNETVWSSGGGGYSHRYAQPSWQNGVNWSSVSGGSTTQRNTPDVAAIAENVYVDSGNGQKGQNFGGTSCAAPLWAAFSALTNQYALSNGKAAMGFINPILYSIGTGSSYTTSMHDIKSGNDGEAAGTGFDMATGWGSPVGQTTINALLGSTTTNPNTVTATVTTPSSNVTIASGTSQSFVGSATDSSSSATLTYSWTFGDGGTATTASASHTYTNTGSSAVTYTATFKATDNTGVSSTVTRTITVNPAAANTVTASITTPSGNVTIASGASQAFVGTGSDSSSTATLTYAWTFGDGGTSTAASTSHTYTNTGSSNVTYTATFKATDNTGVSSTVTRTITVQPAVVSGNTVTASITTPSGNVTVASGTAQAFAGTGSDSASGQTLTYAWTFGDGGTATGASASHTYTNTGSSAVAYTATLTATDTTGAHGSATRTITVSPATTGGTDQIKNGGFESGATSWTASSGVIGVNGPSEPAHAGTYDAWMDGYGSTHTDTVSQSITVPAAGATLSFYLHIDTAETTTSTAYDKLTVTVKHGTTTTTLATFSNLNKATGYTLHSYDLSAYAGQTVTIGFSGKEDSSLQTSFVLDDVSAK